MFKFILKSSFSKPLTACATIFVIALAVVLLYSIFNFNLAVEDYYFGESDPEAGSSNIIISNSASEGSNFVPLVNLKERTDINYAIGSISLYCMYENGEQEEAIYLRTFEKIELEMLHDISPIRPSDADISKILMDSIIVSDTFAKSNDLDIGESITFSALGKEIVFYVGIIAEDNGYFYNNPNVIVGVSSYISQQMGWNLGKIYNNIYISTKDGVNIENLIDELSISPNYLNSSVKLSYDAKDTLERTRIYTTLFDFASAAIILIALIIVFKLYEIMFYRKLDETIKLRVIGLSASKNIIYYSLETLILSSLGALLGALVAVPSFNFMVSSALPSSNVDFSFIYLMIAVLSIIFLSVIISLLPIVQSTKKSIRENMAYSKSPRKKYRLLIPLILLLVYITLLILESTINSLRGIIGVTNTIFSLIVIPSLIPLTVRFIGSILRKIPSKNIILSSLSIGKSENLNISLQMLSMAIMVGIFVFNSLNVMGGYANSTRYYASDKVLIANAGSLTDTDLSTIGALEGIDKVIPINEIYMNIRITEDDSSVFVCGIKGEDLPFYYNLSLSSDQDTIINSINSLDKRYIVVSDAIRYVNNLSIGDIVTLSNKDFTYDYEISGFIQSHYKQGNIVFINPILMASDYKTDNLNYVYITAKEPSTSAADIKNLLPTKNILSVPLSSFVEPVLKTQTSMINFVLNFSIFMESIFFLAVIVNSLMTKIQRKNEIFKLQVLGLTKRNIFVHSLIESLLIGIPISLLSFGAGVIMLFSSTHATLYFDFYQPFVFLPLESILIASCFFIAFAFIPIIYFLVNRPSLSSASIKQE